MATKLIEYTYDKSVGDCTPTLTPNTITMTKSDSTNGNIVTRTISVNSLPTKVSFQNNQALLTVTYFNVSNLTELGYTFKACKKLTTVEISNQTASNLTSMIHTFYDCYALTSVKLTNVNFTNSKGVQLQEMCRNCTSLTEFSVTGTIKVNNFSTAFYNCNKLTSISLTAFDVSSCQIFNSLFDTCTKLETIDISNWDTRSATSFYAMFALCKALTSLDLRHFNIGNVTSISHMFGFCNSLTSLNIQNWNTSKIEQFQGTFKGLKSMPNSFWDLSWMDVSSAKDISYIFEDNVFSEIPNIYNWNTHNVTNFGYMFSKCINLTNVDLTFLDTSSLTGCSGLFAYCTNLTSFNINNWNTSNCGKLTDFVRDCTNLENLDGMKNIDITKVREYNYFAYGCTNLKNISSFENIKFPVESSLYNMLYNCKKVENWESLSTWDVSNVISIAHLLNRTNITSLEPIRNWDVSSVRSMEGFLSGANDLSLEPIRNWDVSEVKNLNYFLDAAQISDVSPIKNWRTPKLESVASMFGYCVNLKKVELPNWITSKVTNMTGLFQRCGNLEYVDLSNWDSSNATMSRMFVECFKLKYIDLSSFDTGSASRSFYQVFLSCTSLKTLDLSNFRIINGLDTNGTFGYCSNLSKIALLYSTASDINTLMSKIKPSIAKEVKVYYYDADPTQLTAISGVTYIKYEFPSTISLPYHINLYALPDGTRDELDVKTGILTRNIGYTKHVPKDLFGITTGFDRGILYDDATERWIGHQPSINYTIFNSIGISNFQRESVATAPISIYKANSDWIGIAIKSAELTYKGYANTQEGFLDYISNEEIMAMYPLTTPTTEKLILNYNHLCEYGRVLPTGAMDYYNVVTSEYLQNISSIELKGEREWDEVVEKTNTVRVLYISTTDIMMKASGGLYCDNNIFPNIQDDSDIEHCRVHDTDNNKLYIYINKDKLMSPDLIGFQIWLQENPFIVYYETTNTIISTKNYDELNPELARWEMMDVYNGGYLETTYNTETGIYPIVDYQAKSTNNFYVPTLENNTTYTVYANTAQEKLDVYLGGSTYSLVSGKPYISGDNNWLRFSSYRVSKNLYNKETSTIGMYVDDRGQENVASNDVYSDYISIKPSTKYSYKIYSNINHNACMAWYDSNKTFIKRVYVGSTNSTTTFESPSNASYLRVGNNNFSNVGGFDVGYALYEGDTCPNIFEDYKHLTYFDDTYNMMVIKGDISNEVVPYFTGIISIVNPTIQSTSNTNNSTVTTNLTLRSSESGVKDSYNVLTGELIQRVDENLQVLEAPIKRTLDPQELLAYENGQILLSSSSGLIPTLTYSVPSTNTFRLPIIKTRTQYTLKYPSASGSITIGNIKYNINSPSMLFTTPLTIIGDTSAIIFSDENPQDVMLIEGAYNTREIPLFTGVKSVVNPTINIIDNGTEESRTYRCQEEVELRSLPNGVADKLDIVGGKLTRAVGIRPYQDGDQDIPNTLTDGYNTIYQLSKPTVSSVTFVTPVVTSDSTMHLSSEALIPQLNYRVPSNNNFPLDLLEPNKTYTLYANTLVSGSYTLGGTHNGYFTGTEVIALGDVTNNLLTFDGDLGLSDVVLIKGNSMNSELPYFEGLKTVENATITIAGMQGEENSITLDDSITLRACGDIKDTIDMVNLVMTQNLSEISLKGTEPWSLITTNESINDEYVLFGLVIGGIKSSVTTSLVCDKFNHKYQSGEMHNQEGIYAVNNQLRICVKKTTIGGETVDAIKTWLGQNNTRVIYALINPIEYQLQNSWTSTPPTSYNNRTTISSQVVDSLKPMISVTIATTTLEEIVSNLEAQNAELEEENIATMLALTSVYETMVAPLVATTSVEPEPQATTYSMRRSVRSAEPIGMSVSPMGMVYARLVSKGFKSIDEVPYNLQAEVMYALRGIE